MQEESEEPMLSVEQLLKGRSYGKMLLKGGLMKLEAGRAEPRMENDETKM